MTPAVEVDIGGHFLYSSPPPGSGVILAAILNVLEHFGVGPRDNFLDLSHKMVEAFKWAYAGRSKLGDPSDPDITYEIKALLTITQLCML